MNKTRLLKKLWCSFLLLLTIQVSFAQNKTVTGRVTDDKGSPLAGATVMAQGSGSGVSTDNSGNFTLSVPPSVNTLLISYVGLDPQQVSMRNAARVNVSLQPMKDGLDAVVVVGYGTQRRRDLTGSVSSVKGESFRSQPITNATEALQGRIAGVNVVKSSGAPDATPTIIIRGLASLNQPNPLYIVDGVRVNDVSNVNVQDIESMDVLKD
ncbi:MAG: TonB-dependent receptor, partial [Segetibacter sp.]|nr:TonB-dependent receptor [Segetibacter sp.]